jgi:hypothetical protein
MQDRYLIDKSALARWTKPSVREVLKPPDEHCHPMRRPTRQRRPMTPSARQPDASPKCSWYPTKRSGSTGRNPSCSTTSDCYLGDPPSVFSHRCPREAAIGHGCGTAHGWLRSG